jgi:capsular exopolysaccharide synthesis family protein
LVTSPDSGTGKTTTVANLGVVCAQAGLRVVLVDADLRRPSLHKQFGLTNGVGLTDLLVGDVQCVTDCVVPTRISGLSIVPSGAVPPNPSELLGSARMGIALEEFHELADLVLLDSPPTLLVADAAVLARLVDRVLLVLRAGETRRDAARQALDNLAQVGGRVIGTVLNAISVHRGSAYYRYYSEGRSKERSNLGRGSVPIIRRTWQWVAEKARRNGHTGDTAGSRTKAKVLEPADSELADDRAADD